MFSFWRLALALVIWTACFVGGVRSAAATSCRFYLSLEDQLRDYSQFSNEIFIGTILSAHQKAMDKSFPIAWEYEIQVDTLYKGRQRRTKYLTYEMGGGLKTGVKYIFCAQQKSTGIEMGICQFAIPYSGNDGAHILNKLVGPGTPATAAWLPSMHPRSILWMQFLAVLLLVVTLLYFRFIWLKNSG